MIQKVVPIALGGVYAYLVLGKKVVLVDTGMPGTEQKVLDQLRSLGINKEALSLIILTHGHSDHFGGSSLLRMQTGAPVLMHALDQEAVKSGRDPELHGASLKGKILSKLMPKEVANYKGYEPDFVIHKAQSLTSYGIEGEIVLLPGHTKGSIGVLLKEGDFIVGDAVQGSFIGKKLGSPLYIEDQEAFQMSLEKIVTKVKGTIYAGHGGSFTPSEVQKLYDRVVLQINK